MPADLWATGQIEEQTAFRQLTIELDPLVQVVDLFCGGGGFSEGAIQAGSQVVLAIDNWQPALDVHIANHPDIPALCYELGGNITDTAVFIREHLTPGAHFHLHGSPPCQALSNASNHNSQDGMALVNWFLQLVDYMKPDSWSMENVVPLGKKLREQHPNVPFVKLNSADFGVAQTRQRIFAGTGWTAVATHDKENWVSVAQALPELRGELEMTSNPNIRQRTINEPMRTITSKTASQTRIVSRRRKKGEEPQHYPPNKPAHTITRLPHIAERLVIPIQRKVGVLKKNGRILQPLWRELDEPIHTITSAQNRLGKLPPEATRENPMIAEKIRSLTLDETKVLQGFPEEYQLPYKKKKDAWVIVGNAVCPPVAAAIIKGLNL